MVEELWSKNKRVGVGTVKRYPAGHVLQWMQADGVRVWSVGFPGGYDEPPRFASEAEAVEFADGVQAEADRRERRKAQRRGKRKQPAR